MAPTKKQMTLLEALMHGGGGGPDGEVLPPLAAKPKFVPNTTPEVDFPADDLGVAVQNMPPEVIQGNPNLNPAQMAAGEAALAGKKPSSRARADKAKPEVAQVAVQAAQEPQQAAAIKDSIAEMLAGKQKEAEGARDSAKAKALASKDMNDGEKIFTALMAVLPGLVGAVGGGAIAGGMGAAAGAAGGLNGGASAVGAMANEKEQQRQEALREAAAAEQRVDQIGNQQLGHAEKLQGQQYQTGERQANQQFQSAQQEDTQAFQAQQNKEAHANQRGNIILQGKIQERLKMLDNEGDLQKAALAAKSGSQKIDDTDVAFSNNTGAAMRAIQDIQTAVKNGAGGAAGFVDIVTNPRARAALGSAMTRLAQSYTKIADPNSAVLLAELENTTKTLLANPDNTRIPILMDRVNELQKEIVSRAVDYAKIRPQVGVNSEIQSVLQGGTQPAANGAPQMTNQQRFGF